MRFLKNLWSLLRPRHWVKSGFVFLGILFANAWRQPQMLERVLLVAVAFSLVASGVYAINDLLDREQDRSHPRKKHRPVAAGEISATTAIGVAIVLWSAGVLIGYAVSVGLVIVLLVYVFSNVAYSLGLKNVVLLDVFIIAGGFMLRILAGTVGVGIPPSQWLLLCGFMIALFLGFAKRRAELYTVTSNGSDQRRVLNQYQPVLLDKMIVITATGVILSYSLYTMSPVTIQVHHTEALIYTVPFVMYGIFRYIFTLHYRAMGNDPTLEILRDPHILISILGWLVLTLWLIAR
jgi:4-hydroxybenzoate polyprenyltransferase